MREKVDARKTRIGPRDVATVLAGAELLLIAKGRKIVRYDLASKELDRAEMLARLIGPTGNLRAPALRRNRMVVVGFHPDALRELVRG